MQPNKEQQIAIDHTGNTCLFAGAGAGKTFVIKEHIFRVVKERVIELSREHIDNELFEKELRAYLSKVSVITFTKKAAREIKIRVEEKFSKGKIEEISIDRQNIIKNEIGHLYVGTIHSFFFKLIREHSINVDEDSIEIKNEYEIQQAVGNHIKEVLNNYIGDQNFLQVAKLQSRIASSVYELLGDIDALNEWIKDLDEYKFDYSSLLKMFDIQINRMVSDLSSYAGKDTKTKWYELLTFINESVPKITDLVSLNQFMTEFKGYRLNLPRGKNAEPLTKSIAEIKKFKDFLGDSYAFCMEMQNDKNTVSSWQKTYRDLALEIKAFLETKNLYGFADIEKLLFELLNNKEIKKSINQNINYLVIDEYQDTSSIQFQIVDKIINGDLSKLYVVGDPKQSIYSFRGGEIDVFFKTASLLQNKCVMKNNYRSTEAVIDFNNHLFEALLSQLGSSYPDLALEVSQVHGNKELLDGKVWKLSPSEMPEDLKKFPAEEMEDDLLRTQISQIHEKYPNDKIAILVRKVKHAVGLAKNLISENQGVSFQLKLYGDESPVILLFKNLVELAIVENSKMGKCLERANRDLGYLGFPVEQMDSSLIQQWKQDIHLFGIENAFLKLSSKIGIQSVGYGDQFELLQIIILSCSGELDLIWQKLKFSSDSSLALEVQTSSNPKFHFMTVHSSKGLEFHHVILGGLYKSQKSRPDTKLLAKSQLEFSFPSSINGEMIKTPEFVLSSRAKRGAEEEESLRLFYVACTRAIKTLSFVHFPGVKTSAGSWIKDAENVLPRIEKYIESVHLDVSGSQKEQVEEFELIIKGEKENKNYVFPEVSVSKLSDLVVCPKLFYLKNVLKLTPDFDSYASEKAISSAERGTEVHAQLEDYVRSNENPPKNLNWASTKIDEVKNVYELFPEEEVKFEVEGQMISGTIDLLGHAKEKLLIVDYKTGKFDLLQNSKYFFQALLYAKAGMKNYPTAKNITLEIWYVDLEKSMRYELMPEDIDLVIGYFWNKMNNYNVTNPSHCTKCFLNNICL